MTLPKIYFSSFLLPKSDSAQTECQDAICTPAGCEACLGQKSEFGKCGSPLRFAVADGVSTAFYSGYWANQLIALFHEGRLCDWNSDGYAWKQEADARWQELIRKCELGTISQNRLAQCEPAAATFCGIEIAERPPEMNQLFWRVIAVGDSCVIHLSESYRSDDAPDAYFISYPCENASAFSCMTAAISNYESNPLPTQFVEKQLPQSLLRNGDVLLLATDALSEWMLKFVKQGKPIWKTIIEVSSDSADHFQQLISQARREVDPERRLKDDDIALIVIRVGDQSASFLDANWLYEPGALLQTDSVQSDESSFSSFLSSALTNPRQQSLLGPKEPTGPESEPRKVTRFECVAKRAKQRLTRIFHWTQEPPSPTTPIVGQAQPFVPGLNEQAPLTQIGERAEAATQLPPDKPN